VLAKFGDDPTRSASAKARKNRGGISPITRRSGKKKTVQARYVHNDRLIDAARALLVGMPYPDERSRARGSAPTPRPHVLEGPSFGAACPVSALVDVAGILRLFREGQ
jgi:hypothetical protein